MSEEILLDCLAGKLTTFDAICGYVSTLEMKCESLERSLSEAVIRAEEQKVSGEKFATAVSNFARYAGVSDGKDMHSTDELLDLFYRADNKRLDERDELKRSLNETQSELKKVLQQQADADGALWECPNCCFEFAAKHVNADGTLSCPVCAEDRLTTENERLTAYAEELKSRAQEAAKAIDRYLWQIKQNDAREDLKGDLQMAAQRCLMDLEDARYGIVELIELPNVAMTALSIPSSNSKPSGEPVTGAQADAAGPGGAESDAPRFDRTLDQLADWLDKKFRRHGEWCDKLAAEALRTFQATAGNLSFEGGGRVKVHDLDALVKSPRVQAQVQAVREMLDAGSFATEHGPVPVEFPGVGNTDPGPRYMVTGYGETEFPEVRMARTLDEVADAYCHLVFGQPFADVLAEAHDEADEFTRQVKDHDWAEEPVFDTWHFEIGGVKVERVYARQFGASTPSQGTER